MRLAVGSAVTLALSVASTPAAFSADDVRCGQELRRDAVLQRDVDCPDTEVGLVIGADGITLDLNGHTVKGGSVGIRNRDHDRVTIRNGTVSGERGVDVLLVDATKNRVRNLEVDGVGAGIVLRNSVPHAPFGGAPDG